MELLNPANPPPPHVCSATLQGLHEFSSSSSTSHRFFHPMVNPSSRGIVQEGCFHGGGGDTVFVAVGKSIEKAVSLLFWTFRRFGDKEICLLHVHQPSSVIPTLLGKLPANQANGYVVAAHRKEEWEQTTHLLENYMSYCHRSKVKAGFLITESEQVHIGIVELVNKHNIRRLVMGTMADNFVRMKVKKSSSKAYYAAKNIPLLCEIWFINKGKHVWTREAVEGSSLSPSLSPELEITENFETRSSQYDRNSFDQECPHSSSENGMTNVVNSIDEEGVISSSSNGYFPCPARSISDFRRLSMERSSSDHNLVVDERSLYRELEEAILEVETSRNEAVTVQLRCRNMELEALDSIKKFKVFKCINEREIEFRKEAEGEMRIVIQEREALSKEKKEAFEGIERTTKSLELINSCTHEVNQKHDEAIAELERVQASIVDLRKEKQKIQKQKIDALNWLIQWKSDKAGSANHNELIGFLESSSQMAEFSLLELETATCGFSESFRIGQSLYKGEMMRKTVAIRRLHPHNTLGPSEFQQQVEIFGKLKHPHLVTLVGVCTEARSLVYEYFPNGSLQNHLFRKGNTPPLTWKIRVRIIAEISSALCFLHSTKPETIVHGDLKPENILFDSEFVSKVCDFGIYRLASEETLYCPSFRQSTEPKGAFSYTDPEFQRVGVLTPKSDIYSFGLIILQLLTGRPIVGLASELRKAVSFGLLSSFLDLSACEWPFDVARRLVDIGLQCCELQSRDRPELTPTLVRELSQLQVSDGRPVPSYFLCPILQEIMFDPQVAADGFTYEGEAVREWLNNGRETSPMTNLNLNHLQLTPNHALRIAIQDWLCKG